MGLKPDHWIKKMALEHRMIEPFVGQQVRDGVISYGLSSYGYDIRVADEFKIFQPEITANKLSDVQCAYVAGAIDGVGQIGYGPPGEGQRSLQLRLSNGSRAALEKTQELLGVGTLRERADGPDYELVISKPADVQHILTQTLPYLVHRRDSAYRALAELKATKSIVVDPKNFDADSFFDFKGEVCIIPPNSFALSRTIEYFRIPRSVLTVCLGKSSYARCGIIVNVTPFEPCYSEDTEVLAADGWRRIADIEIGNNVLTMDAKGRAEWQPVLRKQDYRYNGDMVHFDGKSIDLLVTPEHKVLVRRRTQRRANNGFTEWYTIEAEKILGKHNHEMTRKVLWTGRDVGDEVEINGKRFPTDPLLEFLGLYIGDGSSSIRNRGYQIKIAAIKEDGVYRCAEVLDRLGVHRIRSDKGWMLHDKALFGLVNPLGHAPEKYIPKWVKELPPHRLERLLWGLMHSDGNILTQTYTTTSKQLADDVQEIAFKAGRGAIVRNVGKENREHKGLIFQGKHNIYKVRVVERQLTPKIRPSVHRVVPYKGFVHDVTVPNHLIFVRRNGKAVWSGNCWEGFVTLEISNTTPLPAKIYANEGIAQVLFFEADAECDVSYADRKGKYQAQQTIVLPRL